MYHRVYVSISSMYLRIYMNGCLYHDKMQGAGHPLPSSQGYRTRVAL